MFIKIVFGIIAIAAVMNLAAVDWWLAGQRRERVLQRLETVEERLTSLIVRENASSEVTVAVPVEEEKEEIQAEVVSTPTPAPVVVTKSLATQEVFIPLGSGSTSSTDWTTTGAQAYVDTSIYPRLAAAYFQATLSSNSGAISARLLQKNEGTIVAGSEISHNLPTATLVTSGNVGLSSGNKLYAVELRSETGQTVYVENARLRLVLR